MTQNVFVFAGWLVFVLLLLLPTVCIAADKSVAVLLSREIAPYVSMVKGLEAGLGRKPVQRFFLDKQGQPFTLGGPELSLKPELFSALVAVGPEALAHLLLNNNSVPLFYGMVLNPQNLLTKSPTEPCGVALNIPITVQFSELRKQLPGIRRLGILFDPANNQLWFEEAATIAASMALELVPLQVLGNRGGLELVGDFNRPEALMFIPDKSIISRAVIQYVIKQAVRQRVPVVGYNQFFLDSGAALAFVIDYEQVGAQVAALVENALVDQGCLHIDAPAFELRRNPEVWQALGMAGRWGNE